MGDGWLSLSCIHISQNTMKIKPHRPLELLWPLQRRLLLPRWCPGFLGFDLATLVLLVLLPLEQPPDYAHISNRIANHHNNTSNNPTTLWVVGIKTSSSSESSPARWPGRWDTLSLRPGHLAGLTFRLRLGTCATASHWMKWILLDQWRNGRKQTRFINAFKISFQKMDPHPQGQSVLTKKLDTNHLSGGPDSMAAILDHMRHRDRLYNGPF